MQGLLFLFLVRPSIEAPHLGSQDPLKTFVGNLDQQTSVISTSHKCNTEIGQAFLLLTIPETNTTKDIEVFDNYIKP